MQGKREANCRTWPQGHEGVRTTNLHQDVAAVVLDVYSFNVTRVPAETSDQERLGASPPVRNGFVQRRVLDSGGVGAFARCPNDHVAGMQVHGCLNCEHQDQDDERKTHRCLHCRNCRSAVAKPTHSSLCFQTPA